MLNPRLTLNDGTPIPQLGLGVYQAEPGHKTQASVLAALEAGYRHIDTAQAYGNEADVGAALRASGLRRNDVYVTTKIANRHQGFEAARKSLDHSLEQFGFDTFDLVLIHFPVTGRRTETWRALVEAQRAGTVVSIGVSNYTVRHLKELLETSDVRPAVNQVELSPFCSQSELREFCASHGIVVEAYSPLTRGTKLRHTVLTRIATGLGKTPAQVLLRWGVQHGLVVLPKSVTPSRIAENAAIFGFEIPADDMQALDELDEDYRTCWDPTGVP